MKDDQRAPFGQKGRGTGLRGPGTWGTWEVSPPWQEREAARKVEWSQGHGCEHPQEIALEGIPHGIDAFEGNPREEAPRVGQTLENGAKSANIIRFRPTVHLIMQGGSVNDSVAVDAKRILLRYGAPIAILDRVSEEDRIRFARLVARTSLPDREDRLRELLEDGGYLAEE